MDNEMICFTNPREIDGPPSVVRALAVRDLKETALALGAIVEAGAGQIRSADVGEMMDWPDYDPEANYKLLWAKTPRGAAVEELRQTASAFISATAKLLKAPLE